MSGADLLTINGNSNFILPFFFGKYAISQFKKSPPFNPELTEMSTQLKTGENLQIGFLNAIENSIRPAAYETNGLSKTHVYFSVFFKPNRLAILFSLAAIQIGENACTWMISLLFPSLEAIEFVA